MNEYDEINATKYTYNPPLPERPLEPDRWQVLFVSSPKSKVLIHPESMMPASFAAAVDLARTSNAESEERDNGKEIDLRFFVEHESRVNDEWYPDVW